jgi:uncharacterized membrane protein YeaQ/YmgE (transglycosylase-associated protein family)
LGYSYIPLNDHLSVFGTIKRKEVVNMSILAWIILGAISGWLASIVMKTDAEQGALMNIILGIAGAVVGGYLLNFLGQSGATGFNFYSLFVAFIGAVVLIVIGKAFRRTV